MQPVIGRVAAGTVDRQIRARGTIGGNACFADPASNFPPLLVALDATLEIRGPEGTRTVPASEFFVGMFRTAVGPGELLTSITLPPPAGAAVGYESLQLAADSWALARAVALVRANGTVSEVRVVLGCVAATPVRALATEAALIGGPASADAVAAAAPLAAEGIEPPSDVHASSSYRREMAAVMAKRALLSAINQLTDGRDAGGKEDGGLMTSEPDAVHLIDVTVNGVTQSTPVQARQLLVHFIRESLGLRGTHIGCDTGNCGACSVICDGELVKSCMMLAVQADGREIETIESLGEGIDGLDPIQEAFKAHHGVQCGYCTPGLHPRDKDAPRRERASERRRDPAGAHGQHLPLHRLREHREVGHGGG